MIKILIISSLLLINLLALENIKPTFVFKADAGVTDIVQNDGKLYVSTQGSKVDVFDIKSKKLVYNIIVPQIKDFMGDIADAKIYNVDVLNNNIMLTVQASNGFRELYIYNIKTKKLNKIIGTKDKMYISKALFVDNSHIIFCLLGNTMKYYDINSHKILWSIEVKAPDAEFNSTFSDFALNENRTKAVVSDESGDLKLIDLKLHKVTKVLAGKNLDKVYKVDFKNHKIITAGEDGRCVVYDLSTNSSYFIREKHWFLIYGAGLSPSAKLGAFSSDENNNVTVFNTNTRKKLYKLTGNLMTLTSILFISENEIFISTDSNQFNYYILK